MKIKTLLTVTAAFFIINAPITYLSPGTQLSVYGMTPGPDANYMAQWSSLGSFLIAFIAWIGRNISDPGLQRRIVLMIFVYFVLALVLCLLGMTSGVMGSIGWALTTVCFLFAVGYATFLFRKPAPSLRP